MAFDLEKHRAWCAQVWTSDPATRQELIEVAAGSFCPINNKFDAVGKAKLALVTASVDGDADSYDVAADASDEAGFESSAAQLRANAEQIRSSGKPMLLDIEHWEWA